MVYRLPNFKCAFISWHTQSKSFLKIWPNHGRQMTNAELWSINIHERL